MRGHARPCRAQGAPRLTQINAVEAPIRVNAGLMRFPPDPATLLPALRAPLRVVLAQAPERVLTRLLAAVLTHLLRGQALAGRLPELAGKHVSLLVCDLRRELRFRITPVGLASGWDTAWPKNCSCVCPVKEASFTDGFAPGTSAVHGGWDVRIRGSYDDFWRLAMRNEDPDTLFFQRRLTIEGETETGLMLKNLLDGLEYDWRAHVCAVLGVGLPGAPR